MFGAPKICKNYSSSSGRSAADSNQTLQLQGPELLSLTWPPIIPPGTRSPRHPPLGLLMVQRCLGVRVSRLGESECVTPEDGHEDGGAVASQTLDLGSNTSSFHRAPGQWKMRPVAEQCLLSVFLASSAQSSFSSPDLSFVFVLPTPTLKRWEIFFLVLGKLPSLNLAIKFSHWHLLYFDIPASKHLGELP